MGNHAFTCIAFILQTHFKNVFKSCYDIQEKNSNFFAATYSGAVSAQDFSDLLSEPCADLFYIASDHASHFKYAKTVLASGKRVFIEKPICLNLRELEVLSESFDGKNIFTGLNRKHSPHTKFLIQKLQQNTSGPLTMIAIIQGHHLEPDHWYNQSQQGTRVNGNLIHWIDLFLFLVSKFDPIKQIDISCISGDYDFDDNLSVSLLVNNTHLGTISLLSRVEPVSGIEEQITVQNNQVSASIDNFVATRVHCVTNKVFRFRTLYKEVGHAECVCYPLECEENTYWHSDVISTAVAIQLSENLSKKNKSFSVSVPIYE